jgi:hypothetical protein
MADVLGVLGEIAPSVSPKDLLRFEEFRRSPTEVGAA